MTKQEFTLNLFRYFDADSHQQYGSSRTFSPAERTAFLSHIGELWDQHSIDISPVDLQSGAAVLAMLRAAQRTDCVQDQLAAFQKFYIEEVNRTPQK
jgi:hypothetical protein